VQSRYSKFKTNEQRLLSDMAGEGGCIGGVRVRPLESNGDYEMFGISHGCAQPA
jgi:hypothetical protein